MREFTIGGTGVVLVEVTETHKSGTGVLGADGKELVVDTSFDPLRHARHSGKVICLPSNLGGAPVSQAPVGFPGYGAIRDNPEDADVHRAIYAIGGVFKYKLQHDIEADVRLGDVIWFKPRVLNNPVNKVEEFVDGKVKKMVFRVPYEQIICAVRHHDISHFVGAHLLGTEDSMTGDEFASQWERTMNQVPMPDLKDLIVTVEGKEAPYKVTAKEVTMIGSWVLCKPIMEDWGTVFKKTYYEVKDERGRQVEKPQDQWIQTKTAPGKERMRGIVKFFGKPLKGDDCELEPLMKVWIRRVASEWILDIEDGRYIVCRQNQIMAQEIE